MTSKVTGEVDEEEEEEDVKKSIAISPINSDF